MKTFWNNLSFEEWCRLNDQRCQEFYDGERTLTLPEKFYAMDTDYGRFIQIQPCCLLDEEPVGYLIRDSYYGPMMKVQIPTSAKAGDEIRVVRPSRSGKSLIAEVVKLP